MKKFLCSVLALLTASIAVDAQRAKAPRITGSKRGTAKATALKAPTEAECKLDIDYCFNRFCFDKKTIENGSYSRCGGISASKIVINVEECLATRSVIKQLDLNEGCKPYTYNYSVQLLSGKDIVENQLKRNSKDCASVTIMLDAAKACHAAAIAHDGSIDPGFRTRLAGLCGKTAGGSEEMVDRFYHAGDYGDSNIGALRDMALSGQNTAKRGNWRQVTDGVLAGYMEMAELSCGAEDFALTKINAYGEDERENVELSRLRAQADQTGRNVANRVVNSWFAESDCLNSPLPEGGEFWTYESGGHPDCRVVCEQGYEAVGSTDCRKKEDGSSGMMFAGINLGTTFDYKIEGPEPKPLQVQTLPFIPPDNPGWRDPYPLIEIVKTSPQLNVGTDTEAYYWWLVEGVCKCVESRGIGGTYRVTVDDNCDRQPKDNCETSPSPPMSVTTDTGAAAGGACPAGEGKPNPRDAKGWCKVFFNDCNINSRNIYNALTSGRLCVGGRANNYREYYNVTAKQIASIFGKNDIAIYGDAYKSDLSKYLLDNCPRICTVASNHPPSPPPSAGGEDPDPPAGGGGNIDAFCSLDAIPNNTVAQSFYSYIGANSESLWNSYGCHCNTDRSGSRNDFKYTYEMVTANRSNTRMATSLLSQLFTNVKSCVCRNRSNECAQCGAHAHLGPSGGCVCDAGYKPVSPPTAPPSCEFYTTGELLDSENKNLICTVNENLVYTYLTNIIVPTWTASSKYYSIKEANVTVNNSGANCSSQFSAWTQAADSVLRNGGVHTYLSDLFARYKNCICNVNCNTNMPASSCTDIGGTCKPGTTASRKSASSRDTTGPKDYCDCDCRR